MAQEFTMESVKEFIVSMGGRVKNSELAVHFKHFLNDVHQKELMREKFKNYVNTLATVKLEQNEKMLVLKKRYVPDPNANIQVWELRAHSESPGGTNLPKDQLDSGVSSRIRSNSNLTNTDSMMSSQTLAYDVASLGFTASASSLSSGYYEEESNSSVVSVKDRAQHLNRMVSQSEMQKTSTSNLGSVRKNYTKKGQDTDVDDVSSISSNNSYTLLNPLEKDWLVKASSSDYQTMHQLLSKHPDLVKVRDFMSTALHWAAKHGKAEVIKMLIGKPGINVNQKNGYTALHLAAIYEHDDVIEILIKTCNADPNIRDFNGKKAKQYLSNSATSHTQQLLTTSSLSSKTALDQDDGSFFRNTGGRRSNRESAIKSMIRASNSTLRPTVMLSGWGSSTDVTSENTSPRSSPWSLPRHSVVPSPLQARRQSNTRDRDLMPPPGGLARARHRKPYFSVSKESLHTEEDNQTSTSKHVSRSESEPNLGEMSQSSKTSFI